MTERSALSRKILLLIPPVVLAVYLLVFLRRDYLVHSIKSSLKASQVEYTIDSTNGTKEKVLKIVVVFENGSDVFFSSRGSSTESSGEFPGEGRHASQDHSVPGEVYDTILSKVKLWMAREKLHLDLCQISILVRDKEGYRLETRRFTLS